MNKNWRWLMVSVVAAVLACGVFLVVRARSNLVTLKVREADLHKVIGKIKWQTWEDIYVSPDVKGKVALNVRNVPLEEVLRIIGEQTAARATAVYPIYSSGTTLKQLKATVRTVRAGETSGKSPWQAWQEKAAFRFAGPLGNALRGENRLVNVQFEGKDAAFAAQSLNRISADRVVPEDNTRGLVSLQLSQAAMPDAVAQVARQVKRNWTVFYLLSPAPGMGRPGFPGGNPMTSVTPEQKAEMDKQFEASLATLSPEEQEKAKQRREKMEAIRNLPAEERPQAMQQAMQEMMSDPAMQSQFREQLMNRFTGALKDSTPDQRVERSRMINERRKMFESNPAR